jgi:hypothetical protein
MTVTRSRWPLTLKFEDGETVVFVEEGHPFDKAGQGFRRTSW